jgi:hypothetical protein
MVTLGFAITVLILQDHLQTLDKCLLPARTDILKYWGHLYFPCKSFITATF